MEDLHYWQSNFTPCIYSNKLINKIILLNHKTNNKVDLNKIKQAIYCAKKYHGSQKRDSGEPFYSHPLEVAYMVADYLFETDILIVAILHDTIEDTSLNKQILTDIFDSSIAHKVANLTKIKLSNKDVIHDMIEKLWLQKEKDLLLIKLLDRLHNIQTIEAKHFSKIDKYVKNTLQEFIILSAYLKNTFPPIQQVENNLLKYCYKYLPTNNTLKLFAVPYFEDDFQLKTPYFQK